MTDDADEETLDDRLERIQRRAENFRELLKDGDEVTIACFDSELHVAESYRSKFERKYPKLYGRMLSIEERMKTGLLPYFLGLVGLAVFVIGLQLESWTTILGEALCGILNLWWFYIAAPPSVLYLIYLGCGQWGRHVYRRNRTELADLIAAEELDRDVLLVMLRDESEVDCVVYFLKLDAGPKS